MLTTGLAIGLFMPWRLVSLSVKRSRPMLVQPWRYEFTDEGVSVRNAVGTAEFPWSSLVGVADHAEFWLLHTPVKQQSILVTKAAFSAEDKRVLAEQLPRRVGGATKVA